MGSGVGFSGKWGLYSLLRLRDGCDCWVEWELDLWMGFRWGSRHCLDVVCHGIGDLKGKDSVSGR